MKKIVLIVCLCSAVLVCGCDPGGTAHITIANKTSHDVRVIFEERDRVHLRPNDYPALNIARGGTGTFTLGSLGGYRNPRYELESLVFVNMRSGEMFGADQIFGKLLLDEEDSIFRVDSARKVKRFHTVADISADITDSMLYGSPDVFDDALVRAAYEINKYLPLVTDEEEGIRLDSARALPGTRYRFTYTYLNLRESEVDTEAFVSDMKPVVLDEFRADSGMELFRERGITVVYQYKDKYGVEIASIELSPDEYN